MLMEIALGILITWVLLMVIIPIAQKLGDFELPPMAERAWKLAIMAAALAVASALLGDTFFLIPFIVQFVITWTCMHFFFDADLFGVGMVYFVSMIVNWILSMTLFTMLR